MKDLKITHRQLLTLVSLHNDMQAKVRNNYAEELPKNLPLGAIKVTTLEMYVQDLSKLMDEVFDYNDC
ncbi:hypothetical protein D3C85_293200 [compost metagenome]